MRVVDCSVHSDVRRHEEARENKTASFRREICTCPWARALVGTSLYASHASREPRGAQRHASTASNYQTRNLVARDVRLRRRYDVVTSRDVMLFGNPRAGARVSLSTDERRASAPFIAAPRRRQAPQTLALAHIRFCRHDLGASVTLGAHSSRPTPQRARHRGLLRASLGAGPPRVGAAARVVTGPARRGAGPRIYRSNMGSSRQPIYAV